MGGSTYQPPLETPPDEVSPTNPSAPVPTNPSAPAPEEPTTAPAAE